MYIYQIMSNNFGYIDIILLAMIAGFIILRLRNILGRKTGHQEKTFSAFDEKKFEKFNKEKDQSDIIEEKTGLEGEQKLQEIFDETSRSCEASNKYQLFG